MGKPGETDSPEILGLNSVTLTVNGGRDKITLRPLSLKDKAAARRMDFATEDDLTDWAIWRSAVRGGYEGDQESLLELIEGDEVLACGEALEKLSPKTVAAVRAQESAGAAAETGTGPSGT